MTTKSLLLSGSRARTALSMVASFPFLRIAVRGGTLIVYTPPKTDLRRAILKPVILHCTSQSHLK